MKGQVIPMAIGMILAAQSVRAGESALQVTLEVVEVDRINEDAGEVIRSEVRHASPGQTITFEYADPTNGHDRAVELQVRRATSSEGFAFKFRWLDRTDGSVIQEDERLIIDGSFSLSLYLIQERGKIALLRVTPREANTR